ncbi:MAG: hypothetical protein ABI972_19375 [Acidobacteriota bacterium]
MTTADVILYYQHRIGELQSALSAIQAKQGSAVGILVFVTLVVVAAGVFAYSRKYIPIWYPPLAVPPALLSIRNYGRRRLQAQRLRRLREHYERGESRLDERWAGQGHQGAEFEVAGHRYSVDLNLFGEGSLFERLCTARTHLGRERLAHYLKEPVTKEEALGRQASVRELSARTDLREQIALLGKYDFQESKWQTFADWLDAPSINLSGYLKPVLLVSSACLLGLSLIVLVAPSQWPVFWPPILAIALTHGIVGAVLLRWVRVVLAATRPVSDEIRVIREGLALLSAQSFSSPKLTNLTYRAAGAEHALGQLDPWFFILSQRSKDWWYQLSLWLALGTQSALAIDAWKTQHKHALLDWLDAWAEFEALSAIACYAYETPEDCWPEVTDGQAFFEASALGHPLLPADCVRNDVALGSSVRFWVISGSNMSGKSTLLRSIGLASVLSLAGAPVRAAELRLAAMRVCALISIVDSLREGKSKFLAEVQRLRDTLDASLNQPVLFLIDEIFSGTNSRDRQVAADAVVRTLIQRRAIGAVSTHDISLSSLADPDGKNVHMASSGSDPLDFDYRIKPGVTPETNAIVIARMAGVPV